MGEDARNLSTYPPPPPFYRLYTSAPEDEVDADTRTELDIYTPPPTLTDSFIKFGAIQSVREKHGRSIHWGMWPAIHPALLWSTLPSSIMHTFFLHRSCHNI